MYKLLQFASLLITVIGLFPSVAIAVPVPVVLTSSSEDPVDLAGHVEVLEDTDRRYTIDEVSTNSSLEWHPFKNGSSLGFSHSAFWFRFAFNAPRDASQTYLLIIDFHYLNSIQFYHPNGGSFKSASEGRMRPFAERNWRYNAFALEMPRLAEEKPVYYLRVLSTGPLRIPLSIMTSRRFSEIQRHRYYFFGLYGGAVLAMVFYNLFLFFALRDTSYVFYVLYAIFVLLTSLSMFGFDYEFLWPNATWWSLRSLSVFASAACVFLVLFLRKFLDIKSRALNLSILGLITMGIGVALYSLVEIGNISLVLANGFVALACAFALGVGFAYITKMRQARYFSAAFVLFLIGGIFIVLQNFGMMEKFSGAEYWSLAGSAGEMIILSLALADRINIIENERFRAKMEASVNATRLQTLDQVTRMVAHDIRTPFSLLKMFENALHDDSVENVKKQTRVFREALASSQQTVENLLGDIMRRGTSPKISKVKISCQELWQRSLARVFPQSRPAGIDVKSEGDLTAEISIDNEKFERVFCNIIENAVQAMGGHGKISFRVHRVAEGRRPFVEMTLGNTNSFIPAEYRDHIFEPFFSRGKENGTGLGLAIAKDFVEAHGGKISCDSSETGTKFVIRVPAHSADDVKPPAKTTDISPEDIADESIKTDVAIVDDNIYIRESWRAMLSDRIVHGFSGPAEFWRALDSDQDLESRLACVITDYHFGENADENGVQLARRWMARSSVPVFIASNSESFTDNTNIFRISKEPLTWRDLQRIIREHRPRI